MATQGKLEKMLILAYESAKDAEQGGKVPAKERFEALINPESYTLEYKLQTDKAQAPGTSTVQTKFGYVLPSELTFEFLFDNTGIIESKEKPNKEGVFDEIQQFKKLLIEFNGKSHETYHLVLVWGNLIFKGRAIELSITYKLFNPDGQPIRALAKVKFQGSVEEEKRLAKEYKQSSDLTHIRKVKAGDTLPLMCHQIYGDPKYYLSVANFNNLSNFRTLTPGSELVFPPLDTTSKTAKQ